MFQYMAFLAPFLGLWGCSSTNPEIGPLTFSLDGKSIVFSLLTHNSSHLFMASLSDGHATRLTRSDCGEELGPVFSPRGDALAFSCSGHIFLAKSAGSAAHRLTQSDGNEAMPRFAPDGRRIYVARYGYLGSYSPIAQPYAHE
jgi:Tol biopolymer transport system component